MFGKVISYINIYIYIILILIILFLDLTHCRDAFIRLESVTVLTNMACTEVY